MKLTNVYNAEVPTKNLITTITGIILLVIPILVITGVITGDQGDTLQTQLGVIGASVTAIISAIASIILIFKSKDA